MVWRKIAKHAFFIGNFVRGFLDGSVDEVFETFTDAEVTRFKDTADILENRNLRENHLKVNGYDEINRALKHKNYEQARKAVADHATETADPSCIAALKMALVNVCTKCTTLIKRPLPTNIVIPKS
jgi:hypothetical protein